MKIAATCYRLSMANDSPVSVKNSNDGVFIINEHQYHNQGYEDDENILEKKENDTKIVTHENNGQDIFGIFSEEPIITYKDKGNYIKIYVVFHLVC